MPLYSKEILSDNLLLGIWKIEESEELFSQILLPQEFADACGQIHSPKRRLERCAVRALLRILTGTYNKIIYDKNGKPGLFENNMNISVSHTRGYAAVALHPTKEVGIDMEIPSAKIVKVRKHVFSPSEIRTTTSEDLMKEEILATLYWCAKETVYKIVGKAVFDYRQNIEIPPFHIEKEGMILVKMPHNAANSSLIVSYKIGEDFVLTWSLK